MHISEMIKELQSILDYYGDCEAVNSEGEEVKSVDFRYNRAFIEGEWYAKKTTKKKETNQNTRL